MRRALAWTGTVALATGGWFVLGGGGDADAAPIDVEFEYSGAEEPFVVPANVCEVFILAIGAAGGDGSAPSNTPDTTSAGEIDPNGQLQPPGSGALGGSVSVVVPVTPGETLDVVVGGAGEDGEFSMGVPIDSADERQPQTLGGPDNGGPGGFNGGGGGGDGESGAGGGGGASEVLRAGGPLVVAGAGGGGGGYFTGGNGGAGGGPGENGSDASSGAQGGDSGGNGGGGGAPSGGGETGENGTPGQGGEGGSLLDAGGGGGGGAQGGGGGGSNNFGLLIGGGGGGAGSSTGPDGAVFESTVEGDAAGNGEIVIGYDAESGTCGPQAVVVEPRFTG